MVYVLLIACQGLVNCLGVFSRMKAAELAPQVADFRVTVPINVDAIAFIKCWDATEQRLSRLISRNATYRHVYN